ncbi:DEAD/DEAH box helicase [uncultured Ruegeria sp.]|uniref:DEAD/DEAH box helicase n=1 Tax=uncultured Ruegeria sp. TaxID=259304 RepID=UPI0026066D32|nr:DEAD/DEAH box helicase [uncultured Ruegeria sp.]
MQLRDYQSAAIEATYKFFQQGRGNPLIVAPTGAGKSVILAEFIRRAIDDYPSTRIICATHVKELIQQNFQALIRLWPEAPAGIYSAGLNRRQTSRAITFAGIQSVAKRADEFGHIDLLIVDECHLIPRKSGTMYQRFIEGLRDTNPNLKIIGLTATPFRLDSGRLDSGDGAIFDGIAYDIPISMLVGRGYLAPLVSKSPSFVFDTKGLHTRNGDWIESEMVERFGTDEITSSAVREIMELGRDRRSWLLFCISVEHAVSVRDALIQNGVSAAVVTGSTPATERAQILSDFKAGKLRAVTNVNVLTTGFDAPATDLLAFLRPTQSLGLYMQMAGRAMRIADGKANGLVLDYAGNVQRHGPVDAIEVGEKKAKFGKQEEPFDQDAPSKICPECQSILFITARECPDCGYEFPPPEPKIERQATTAAIMNMTAEDDWRVVQDFQIGEHDPNDGRPISMRVEYLIDGRVVSEWVCFEHTGFARQKAVQWWHANAGTTPPNSVAEALGRQDEIRTPSEAVVRREGKYDRIARVRGDAAEQAA